MDNRTTKNLPRAFFFIVVFCFPGLLQASVINKGFEYIYSLSKNDFTFAHVNRKLEVVNNKLTFTSYAYPVGFASLFVSDTITEQSIIHIKDNLLVPQSYSYVKQADEIKKQFFIRFDWKKNIATDSRIDKSLKLTRDSFDPLSFQLALANRLATPEPGLSYTLVDNKHSRTYQLEPQGKEQLETDAGIFNTLKYTYFDEVKKRKVIIWCARQLDYLPVQVKRIDSDGDYATLKLISLKPRAASVKETDDSNADF